MHILYLDESGSVFDESQEYFVLAGVCAFERATHWIEQRLNAIAKQFESDDAHILELHGSPMRSGREGWKRFPVQVRMEAIKDALKDGIAVQPHVSVRLFGAVIKKASLNGESAVDHAFERISHRFDNFLQRCYRKHQDAQRGVILFDKSTAESRIQRLARQFKYVGHAGGKTRNFAEVPLFLDSRSSRLIQLADLVAFALFRHFEHGDTQFFDIIKHRFETDGGDENGLYFFPSLDQIIPRDSTYELEALLQ
jgi:hypothetical protein